MFKPAICPDPGSRAGGPGATPAGRLGQPLHRQRQLALVLLRRRLPAVRAHQAPPGHARVRRLGNGLSLQRADHPRLQSPPLLGPLRHPGHAHGRKNARPGRPGGLRRPLLARPRDRAARILFHFAGRLQHQGRTHCHHPRRLPPLHLPRGQGQLPRLRPRPRVGHVENVQLLRPPHRPGRVRGQRNPGRQPAPAQGGPDLFRHPVRPALRPVRRLGPGRGRGRGQGRRGAGRGVRAL